MTRLSHHPRGSLKSQSFIYIVPFLLITALIIALIYGRFDKDKESGPELPPIEIKQVSHGITMVTEFIPNPVEALIEQAKTMISDESSKGSPSKIVDARTKLVEAYQMTPSREEHKLTFIMDQISALTDKMLLGIKMDGLFNDWRNYKVGWQETGKEGVSFEHNIDIKEFYYKTDNNYVYLFFKCTPSIVERHQKYGYSGIFAYLYIDSDSNKDTGATKIPMGGSGNSAMLGTDYRIWIPIGVGTHGCSIWCYINKWDSSSEDFSIEIRKECSYFQNPLIAHGDDGIEIALLLSDIQKSQGDRFDFICVEWANNEPKYANRIQIEIE